MTTVTTDEYNTLVGDEKEEAKLRRLEENLQVNTSGLDVTMMTTTTTIKQTKLVVQNTNSKLFFQSCRVTTPAKFEAAIHFAILVNEG